MQPCCDFLFTTAFLKTNLYKGSVVIRRVGINVYQSKKRGSGEDIFGDKNCWEQPYFEGQTVATEIYSETPFPNWGKISIFGYAHIILT